MAPLLCIFFLFDKPFTTDNILVRIIIGKCLRDRIRATHLTNFNILRGQKSLQGFHIIIPMIKEIFVLIMRNVLCLWTNPITRKWWLNACCCCFWCVQQFGGGVVQSLTNREFWLFRGRDGGRTNGSPLAAVWPFVRPFNSCVKGNNNK